MRIDESVIKEVLARTDIGGFIGNFVALRKRGNDLVGLCPFHGEKTPSFHVHPDKGFFKCFGCGAGGDVIAFAARLENVPFPEAVRALAKRAGIEVEPETPASARVRSEKEAIYAANEIAAAFFHQTLKIGEAGAPARAYCEHRGLRAQTIDAFKLGYAPPEWGGLFEELRRAGIDPALAVKAGLVKSGQHGFYDFYRRRLMIPTYAATGEVVAFGGRSLDGSEPKYLNTATTPVYTKGRGLFALNIARRHTAARNALIVVEGYLDCIALHQAGFQEAVASLGTAFTAEQAAELRKYTENVFVCFDADAAGNAATGKSIDVLVAAGLSARIIALPPGEDPDSYVRANGAPAFEALMESAVPWIEYKLDRALEGIRTKFVSASAIAREAERLVQSLPREEWDRWRVYVASRLGLQPDDIRASRFLGDAQNFAPREAAAFTRHLAPAARPIGVDRDILMVLLDEPSLVAHYAQAIAPERFTDPIFRGVYEALLARRDDILTSADVFAALGEDRASNELLVGLQKSDRTTAIRFADTAARRAHLDRIVERFATEDDERRKREVENRIAERFSAGQQVPQAERDEYQHLIEKLELAARRRLGTKS
jgi:DNA primase